MIPIIITGAAGRMGKMIIQLAVQSKNYQIVGATERPDSQLVGQDAGSAAGVGALGVVLSKSIEEVFASKPVSSLKEKPVVIDFTLPEGTLLNLKVVADNQAHLVIGTTGLTNDQKDIIRLEARKIPIVMSPNMSVGVNTMFQLVGDAAAMLGKEYDIEILEAHHRLKKDAPSGTAVRIGEILAEATNRRYPQDFNFHRQGITGERDRREIGMQVIRGGDIVGEHTVFYCGTGEQLEIRHVATSRAPFAEGALRAASWIRGKKAGLYDMRDVLGRR